MKRRPYLALATLTLAAIAALSVDLLWPLVPVDLAVPRARTEAHARRFLETRGCDVRDHVFSRQFVMATAAIDSLDPTNRDAVLAQLTLQAPVAIYSARFADPASATTCSVDILADGRIAGWMTSPIGALEPTPMTDAAGFARDELARLMDLDTSQYRLIETRTQGRRGGVLQTLVFERPIPGAPLLRETLRARVAGSDAGHRVVSARRRLASAASDVPPDRSAHAALTVAIALASLGAAGAFVIFFVRGLDRDVRWREIAAWPIVSLLAVAGVLWIEPSLTWSSAPTLTQWLARCAGDLWLPLVILLFAGAGDALDRAAGATRGSALWCLGRGSVFDPRVGVAAARSLPLTFACGGVFALGVLGLGLFGDVDIQVQPRGMMLLTVNAAWPAVSTLLVYFSVAVAEELGYRFFLGSWLDARTGSRALAIVLPALLYGVMHSAQEVLPPVDPAWGRAFVMTLVGCVWGWAYFRYGALTVVLSHLTADLFIALWPRIASGEPWVVLPALATVALPVTPAIAWVVRSIRRRAPA